MKTATLIKPNLPGYTGDAGLYRCDPPLQGNELVVASATFVMFSGPETYLFAADEEGGVTDWLELEGSYRGGLSHEQAFENAGYTVVIE